MILINNEHINFLRPLEDWRILDIYSLAALANNRRYSKIDNIRKLIQRLVQKGILKSVRDPWSKRVYVYLSPLGQKYVAPDFPASLKEDQLYHDIQVTLLGLALIRLDQVIKSVELEHKIQKEKGGSVLGEYIPDAIATGRFKGKSFVAAIELELNQKEKGRIIAKANRYLKSTYYDAVFYFFPDMILLNRYKEIYSEMIDCDFNKKIFLFVFDVKLRQFTRDGWCMNRSQSILELFEVDSLVPD
jgi:DNA-binding MarR family transcriptional regulator